MYAISVFLYLVRRSRYGDFYPAQQLLDKLYSLIRPNHSFLLSLYWGQDDKYSETSKREQAAKPGR